MLTLFTSGRQLLKVRFVIWLSVACAAATLYWGVDLAQNYGLAPGDGGVLAPLSKRLAWGVSVSLLGIAFAIGMLIYGRCYVARIELDELNNTLIMYTVNLFGTHKSMYSLDQITDTKYHQGRFRGRINVNAPWRAVHIAGRSLPLIIDQQGEALHPLLLKKYFGVKVE